MWSRRVHQQVFRFVRQRCVGSSQWTHNQIQMRLVHGRMSFPPSSGAVTRFLASNASGSSPPSALGGCRPWSSNGVVRSISVDARDRRRSSWNGAGGGKGNNHSVKWRPRQQQQRQPDSAASASQSEVIDDEQDDDWENENDYVFNGSRKTKVLTKSQRLQLGNDYKREYEALMQQYYGPPETTMATVQFRNRMNALVRKCLDINAHDLGCESFMQFDSVNQEIPLRLTAYELGLRLLIRSGRCKEMFEIFKKYRAIYHEQERQLDDVFYRFGLHALCFSGRALQAMEVLFEMIKNGHEQPNECFGIVMLALAKQDPVNNKEAVMQLFEMLNPKRGVWNHRSIDRIILTLSAVKEPKLAFDFFMQTTIPVNAHSLMALLQCCRDNDCVDQARRLLQHRQEFNVRFHAHHYNKLLETLEWLGQHHDILGVLQELVDRRIAFSAPTDTIVMRNQQVLQNTDFDLSLTSPKPTTCDGSFLSTYQLRFFHLRLQELVRNHQFEDAAAIAKQLMQTFERYHQYNRQQQEQDVSTANRTSTKATAAKYPCIPTELGTVIVEALISADKHDDLEHVVDCFEAHNGKYGTALLHILRVYHVRALKKPSHVRFSSLAYKAMQTFEFEGRQVRYLRQRCEVLALRVGHGHVTESKRLMTCLDQHLGDLNKSKLGEMKYFAQLLRKPNKLSEHQVTTLLQPLRAKYGVHN